MRTVVCDSEGDGLEPTVFWCVVCKDVNTGEVFKFKLSEVKTEFIQFASTVEHWIGHNFISWDVPHFKRLLNLDIKVQNITDTLVLSRLAKPNRFGNHSIENWGRILGVQKPPINDWSTYTDDMLHRCSEDVEITFKVWERLTKTLAGFSKRSIRLEHSLQKIMIEVEKTGFKLDVPKAQKLFNKLSDLEASLKEAILKDFKPIPKLIRSVAPKRTKKGVLSKVGLSGVESVEGSFSLVEFVPFNLASPKQVVARLNSVGWKPFERTKGYSKLVENKSKGKITEELFKASSALSWKLSEDNLSTVPETAPESIKNIAKWMMTQSRKTLVETWLSLSDKNDRVHGRVNTLGTWTHRMTHYDPNMANVPGVNFDEDSGEILYGIKGRFGFEARSCWTVDSGRVLLGVDAKGIQLRALAHYTGDPEYIKTVHTADPHTYHAGLLSEISGNQIRRDTAKTFIYAYLLGAGVAKISNILGSSCGAKVKKLFPQYLPGLERLMSELDKDAKRGYMIGLDGRLLSLPSRHKALAARLQSFEKVIIGKSIVSSYKEVKNKCLDSNLVAVVHDEEQWDTLEKDLDNTREIVVRSIKEAGEYYETKCPMEGEAKVSKTWAGAH